MWWAEFEKVLTRSFAIIRKAENRNVHSNDMKLRILMGKIQADFLSQAKAALSIDMTRTPTTLTYETVIITFRNIANAKYPTNVSSNIRARRVSENNSYERDNPGSGRFPLGEEDMVVVEVNLVEVEALEGSEAEEDVTITMVDIITPDLMLSMDSRNQETHGWLLPQMERQ